MKTADREQVRAAAIIASVMIVLGFFLAWFGATEEIGIALELAGASLATVYLGWIIGRFVSPRR